MRAVTLSRTQRVLVVYGAGVLQGAAFVLVPSLGRILAAAPYRLDAAAYGVLYLPEIAGAILGALAAGRVARRFGDGALLRTGLVVNAVGMGLLALASLLRGRGAYLAILAETLCLGVGFGLTLATLNPSAARLFAKHPTTAVTALNGLVGGATALAPLALELARRLGHWGLLPLALAAGFVLGATLAPPSGQSDTGAAARRPGIVTAMLPFAFAVLIYAVAEGTFSSWAQIYVARQGGVDAARAALALSAFWAGLTLLRLVLGVVPEHGASRRVLFLLSALGIGAAFAVLSRSTGTDALIAGFGAAGAACSIYYPYAMAFGLARWPDRPVVLAGLLVAALMIGEGTGSLVPGALQRLVGLRSIYLAASALALPLAYFAWRLSSGRS
jgi:fucose permease